ncbi:MAG TPA: hypothetical protein ENK78_09050 [Thiothrix sp.]|nr:hypothetical protein [Thiothrix sp.]
MNHSSNDCILVLARIPDLDTGRRLYNLGDLDAKGTAKALYHLRKQHTGKTELPPYLYRIRALLFGEPKHETSHTINDAPSPTYTFQFFADSDEKQLLQRFLQHYQPATQRLMSWQGTQLDFPNLHYRLLKHGFAPLNPTQQISLYDVLSPFPQLSAEDKPSLAQSQALFNLSSRDQSPTYFADDSDGEYLWQAHQKNDQRAIQQHLQQQADSMVQLLSAMSPTFI